MPGPDRTLVCACEDVTLGDVEAAIDKGYRDVESVKRYTGFGTGICQGRTCLPVVARLLHAAGVPTGAIEPMTPRPPLDLIPLGEIAPWADEAPTSGSTAASGASDETPGTEQAP